MSYFDRTTDPARRTTAIAGVVIVHALLGYVLLTGLAAKYAPQIVPRIVTTFDPAPMPPPSSTPPPQKPDKPVLQRHPLPF